ncbi:MAG: aldehyde dehydrogenase family protein [Granulosicoccus sp.]
MTHARSLIIYGEDEVFGPIAAVLRVPNYETALSTANDHEFGLSAGIVSKDATKVVHEGCKQ